MPTIDISIKERIELKLLSVLAGVSGIGTVYRYDARGIHNFVNLNGWIHAQEETATANDAIGAPGPTRKVLQCEAGVCLLTPESTDLCDAYSHNHWLALIEKALVTDPYLIEGAGVGNSQQLSHTGLYVTGTRMDVDLVQPGLTHSVVSFEVPYRHDGGNPYTYGTAITLYSPATLPTGTKTG